MPGNVSPEERLFKVIQNGKNAPVKPKRGPIPFRMPMAMALPMPLRAEDLKSINKLLVLALIIISAAAFYYLLSKRPSITAITREATEAPLEMRKRKTIEVFKPLSFYMEAVEERNILNAAPKEIEEADIVEEEEAEPQLPELASLFKLQGISWGAIPKAMIQDTGDGQMFFLKKGQRIGATGIDVREITKDKVTIGFEEEEMELL